MHKNESGFCSLGAQNLLGEIDVNRQWPHAMRRNATNQNLYTGRWD